MHGVWAGEIHKRAGSAVWKKGAVFNQTLPPAVAHQVSCKVSSTNTTHKWRKKDSLRNAALMFLGYQRSWNNNNIIIIMIFFSWVASYHGSCTASVCYTRGDIQAAFSSILYPKKKLYFGAKFRETLTRSLRRRLQYKWVKLTFTWNTADSGVRNKDKTSTTV